ncbi:MAG TPA: DNA-binding protein [Chloroflexota bacterium]|nr:DNA-binding protein [Chloroflexota bacterium]
MTVESTRGFPKGVPAPAIRALNSAGYHDLTDPADVPIANLKNLHGIGPKALRLIQAALAAHGLSLPESESGR